MAGRWSITRDLLDCSTGQRGTFTGDLVVFADADGFSWQESGTLRWRATDAPAGRSLRLRELDGQWWMTFVDGHPFHRWAFDTELRHPCGADLYLGRLTAPAADELHTSWDVTGPHKSQRIVTRLVRHKADPASPHPETAHRTLRP